MIKGVNKKIIEINNPDSIYFERAIFYLRPNVRELPQEVSNTEISQYISKLGLEYDKARRSICKGKIIIAVLAVLALIALIFVFVH